MILNVHGFNLFTTEGAFSGIGGEIATSFAKQGASLIVTGRNAMKLTETAEKCKAAGSPNVSFVNRPV